MTSRRCRIALPLLVIGCFLNVGTSALADSVVLETLDMGWYTSQGRHDDFNDNTLTGSLGGDPSEYRSFYLWNIPEFGGTLVSARVEMRVQGFSGPTNQIGDMFDLSDSSLATISQTDGAGAGSAIFGDLGSGQTYGRFTISASDDLTWVSYVLNESALSAIAGKRDGVFGMGIDNASMPPVLGNWGYFLFSDMSTPTRQRLVLEVNPVPAPATLWLMISSLASIGAYRWRRPTVRDF